MASHFIGQLNLFFLRFHTPLAHYNTKNGPYNTCPFTHLSDFMTLNMVRMTVLPVWKLYPFPLLSSQMYETDLGKTSMLESKSPYWIT